MDIREEAGRFGIMKAKGVSGKVKLKHLCFKEGKQAKSVHWIRSYYSDFREKHLLDWQE